MTVKEIIIKYLKDNGYDGLCHPDADCGCGLEDLIPCGEDCSDCEPGYDSGIRDEEGSGIFITKPEDSI